jgi:HK97 family phage portal protein
VRLHLSRPSRVATVERGLGQQWGDPSAIPPPGMSHGRLAAGLVVSERTALQISTVMTCVRELGGDVAGLAVDEQERTGEGRWRTVDPSPLVEDPFIDLAPEVGWFQVMASLLLRGNSWNRIVERDRLGYATKLLPLHPDHVRPRFVGGKKVLLVDNQPVPLGDILHIPGIVLPGGWLGLDPIAFHAQALGLALATETYGAQYFANGTVVSGVLQSDQPLNDEQVRRTLQLWRKSHQGLGNAHLPAVLGNGLKWQPMTVAPNEAQFLETRDYQRHEIAALFGVEPDRVGAVGKHASQGGGKGSEQRELRYVKHTVRFWLSRLESATRRQLRPGRRARWNLESLLRADLAARNASYSAGRAGGWLNRDEIRAYEDLPPLPNGAGQDYDAPLNSAHSDGTTTGTGEPRDDAGDDEETP